jgi:glucoselysine-6-phosphate deglycase
MVLIFPTPFAYSRRSNKNMEDTMYGYIQESGQLVRDNVNKSLELTKSAVDKYCEKDFNRILIIASGSSYNGAFCSRFFMEKVLKIL